MLFCFNIPNDSEFRFWFSRRVTLFILAATSHLVIKSLQHSHSPEVVFINKQGEEDLLSRDLILLGGANINMKMAGPTLQAMCLLLNQLREHAAWGEVPQVQDVATTDKNTNEAKKPLIH